jgi:3-deoxy-D-manno-octulosonate 8-phosphate phosphatase KdsC-like HAD superfamily phosphatase
MAWEKSRQWACKDGGQPGCIPADGAFFTGHWFLRARRQETCVKERLPGVRNKGTGIEEICGWLAISAKDVLAVGNDAEDDAMEKVCGAYIRIGKY